MSISIYKTFVSGETLPAADLNGLQSNLITALGDVNLITFADTSTVGVDLQPPAGEDILLNGVITRVTRAQTATLQTVSDGTETDLTTLSAIALPRTDTVSAKTFRVEACIHAGSSGGAKDITFTLYEGANGTKADTVVETWDISFVSGGEDTVHIDYHFTPADDANVKVGFSVTNSAATASEFNNGHSSSVTVSELLT